MEKLTLEEARERILRSQGLAEKRSFASVADAVRHLSYVQIDTISVIERAHHHTLWTRVPGFTPSALADAVAKREVFEYWSHAAAFLPMEDFRFCLPRMQRYRRGENIWSRKGIDPKLKREVLARIRAEGPLQSKDFEAKRPKKTPVWFEWKPAKVALEQLFMEGRLLIGERRGFQKVYDLAERVLPDSIDQTPPTKAEYASYLIQRTLSAQGLATAEEIAYLRRGDIKETVTKEIRRQAKEGLITPLEVEGIEGTYYRRTTEEPDSNRNSNGNRTENHTEPESRKPNSNANPNSNREPNRSPLHILSPFDNLVIQRRRLQKFFSFDYQIECYVPEPKRKFGYFCLPILRGGDFLGRIDAKADRASGRFLVRKIWVEKGVDAEAALADLRPELDDFARFNGCERVTLPRRIRTGV